MNKKCGIAFNENFEAIGQALIGRFADLEEIAVAESGMVFLRTWIMGECKYCSGI